MSYATMNFTSTAIHALRKKNGWTLNELSSRSTVSKGMLSKLENFTLHETNPSWATIRKLAQAFKVKFTIDYP